VMAGEAEREPFLLLAAIFSLPGDTDEMIGKIVSDPPRRLADQLDRAHIRFLVELAQRALIGILAGIDAALRHLPCVSGVLIAALGALADENAALAVDEHHAHAGAIEKIRFRHDRESRRD